MRRHRSISIREWCGRGTHTCALLVGANESPTNSQRIANKSPPNPQQIGHESPTNRHRFPDKSTTNPQQTADKILRKSPTNPPPNPLHLPLRHQHSDLRLDSKMKRPNREASAARIAPFTRVAERTRSFARADVRAGRTLRAKRTLRANYLMWRSGGVPPPCVRVQEDNLAMLIFVLNII